MAEQASQEVVAKQGKNKPAFRYQFDGQSVRIVTNGETISTHELLSIPSDPNSLVTTMAEHPALVAWVGVIAADAEADAEAAKKELESIEASVGIDLREEWSRDPEIKITEDKIKSFVKIDDDYLEALDNYLAASRKAKTLDVLTDAMRTRGVLLASLAGIFRDEFRAYHSNAAA